MRNLSELNINEGGEPVTRPAPTKDVINAFQARFGLVLPEEYLRILRHSNGGHPELDAVEPIAAGWAINHFYHLDDDRTSTRSLWFATEEWRSVLGKNALPFAESGGGDPFFLDLTTTPPSVKVCAHDENCAIVDLAPSLEAFIDGLTIDPDMI